MKGVKYIVVEMAGMVGEADVASFGTFWAAEGWMKRIYSAQERDTGHDNCLHPAICAEVDGVRSYDV